MHVNPVQLLPTEALRPNPENPKRPLGLKYKRGLREALSAYGFAGVLVVAANGDGTYEVLDGNTRLDELEKEGVEQVPCVVLHGLSADDRREFVLAHDRHRKVFDEDVVLAQLQALAEKGRDAARLGLLSGKDNIARLLAARQAPAAGAMAPAAKAPTMASLVLYGPAEDLDAIKGLLKQIKGKLLLTRARAALDQAAAFMQWDDDRVCAVLLATVARFMREGEEGGEGHAQRPQAETDAAEGAAEQSGSPPAQRRGAKGRRAGARSAG